MPSKSGAARRARPWRVDAAAKALGIPRDKVKLNDMLLGGGFGRRGHRDEEFIVDAVLLSKEAKRPVKVLWTREDDVHNGRFRPITAHYLRAGLDASGKIVAWHHRVAGDRVTPFQDPVRYEIAKRQGLHPMRGIELKSYDIPNQHGELVYRDTGVRTSSAARHRLRRQQVRERSLHGRDRAQARHRSGRVAARTAEEHAARRRPWSSAWPRWRTGARSATARGWALPIIDYSGTRSPASPKFRVDRASGAIRVHNFWCAIDCGVAVQPDNVVAQTESSIVYGLGMALTERITIKDGAVEQSNFYDYQVRA